MSDLIRASLQCRLARQHRNLLAGGLPFWRLNGIGKI
jgi:hypothetical protein